MISRLEALDGRSSESKGVLNLSNVVLRVSKLELSSTVVPVSVRAFVDILLGWLSANV